MDKYNNMIGNVKVNSFMQILLEDDVFFRLIKGSRFQSLTQIMKEKDYTILKDYIYNIKDNDERCFVFEITRMDDTKFTALLICKSLNILFFEEKVISISFVNINEINKSYKNMLSENNKLDNILSLTYTRILKYDTKLKTISIYNSKGEYLFRNETFNNWRIMMLTEKFIPLNEISIFENICNDLENLKTNFDYTINLLINGIYQHHRFLGKAIYHNSEVLDMIAILSPINQETSHNTSLEKSSKFDMLTYLLNKVEINKYAKEKIDNNPDYPITLIIFDIDDFKEVNDNYGHMYGDYVLTKIAAIVKNIVGLSGTIGRIGGDELLVVLHDIGEDDQIRNIVKILRLQLVWEFATQPMPIKISCSMGISTYPKDGNSFDDLFNKADKALYIAKTKGKNRYIIYDENKHGKLEQDLRSYTLIDSGYLKNEYNEAAFIANCLIQLFQNPNTNFLDIIEEIGTRYSIERINLFTGPKLKLLAKWGKYKEINDAQYIKSENYYKYFNEDGFLVINNSYFLEARDDLCFNILIKKGITATVQLLFKNDFGEIVGLISFDMCKSFRTWRQFELNCLYLVGQSILRITLK